MFLDPCTVVSCIGGPVEQTLSRLTWEVEASRFPVREITRALERHGFARLRGICSPQAVEAGVAKLNERFDARDDHATVGETPAAVRDNFQKLSVGTAAGSHRVGDRYARLLRVIFNPLIAEDCYGLHAVFRPAAEVRNLLLGLPRNFACDAIEGGLFTASRVQHYPAGGGFLGVHRDETSAANVASWAQRYLQLVIVLTKRGIDFETGGAFVERDSHRIDVEAEVEVGDIVVYDGSLRHGVDDIDPHRVLNLDTLSGRLAGFVTLYRTM